MKLNHLIYTLMLGTALGTSSCSWLDLEPATAVSPSILGQGEVEQLLTGTYRSIQHDPGRDPSELFDMRGENLLNHYLSGSNDFVNNEIPSNNGTLLTMWRDYYKAIYNANTTLSILSNLEPSEKNTHIEAQARFLRAYAYYCLATRWDGVPIIKDNTLENVKRDKQSAVFNFIKEELSFCIDEGHLKPFGETSGAPFTVSLEAAQALMARLALTTGDMETAKNMAETLIANPKFKLSENYDNIFTTTNNSEIIFSLRNNTSEGGQNLYALFTTYNSPMNGSWFLCPSPVSEKLFEDPADTRNNTCITTLESVSATYNKMNKFRDFTPLIVSRIAEMYLISAEAQGRNGLNRLNELRRSRGMNPYIILILSFLAGAVAGICTGLIHVKCKVRDLLSGIIMMTALWTINLRLAGTANVPIIGEDSIFDNAAVNGIFQGGASSYKVLVIVLIIAVVSKVLLDLYMKTKSGFLLRAVGDNEVLVTSLAKDEGNVKILGLAIANGLVSLAGSIFCQEQRVFEISSGTGAIVIGLASVIIGTSLFKNFSFLKTTTAVLIGSIIFIACVAAALKFFEPQDMKLITAVLFLLILVIGRDRKKKVKKNA